MVPDSKYVKRSQSERCFYNRTNRLKLIPRLSERGLNCKSEHATISFAVKISVGVSWCRYPLQAASSTPLISVAMPVN